MDTFKFITNITKPLGGGPTLEEYAKSILEKKAAGVAAPENDDGKPDTEKGQVISDKGEAGEGHQDGESVKGKGSDKKKSEKAEVKEAAGKAKAEDSKCEGMEISLPADKEFQKGESPKASKVTKKEAANKQASGWVKISNLNEKEKKMLKNYWLTQYPREYVDAMIQDK